MNDTITLLVEIVEIVEIVETSGLSVPSLFETILESYLVYTCNQIRTTNIKRPGSSHIENRGIDYQISPSISDVLDASLLLQHRKMIRLKERSNDKRISDWWIRNSDR